MKKYVILAIAAVTFAACGNKSGEQAPATDSATETTEASAGQQAYITYTNDKYGFSVEVPEGMIQKGQLMADEGTVFSADPEDAGVTFNRIDISGGKQIFDEEYTPEKVKEEFESWVGDMEVDSKECGDDYFCYTVKGDFVNELHRHVFKGTTKVLISICYEPDHENVLGGEVAEHVFNSVKFK